MPICPTYDILKRFHIWLRIFGTQLYALNKYVPPSLRPKFQACIFSFLKLVKNVFTSRVLPRRVPHIRLHKRSGTAPLPFPIRLQKGGRPALLVKPTLEISSYLDEFTPYFGTNAVDDDIALCGECSAFRNTHDPLVTSRMKPIASICPSSVTESIPLIT